MRALLAGCVVILAVGCGGPTQTRQAAHALPTSVLDGTDERTVNDLPEAPLEISTIAGTYEADQGGAMLTLIVRVEGDVIQVQRTFREPTMDERTRGYELTVDASQALSEDAALRRTVEGVLLWERASSVEGIPDDWWSLYRRVTP